MFFPNDIEKKKSKIRLPKKSQIIVTQIDSFLHLGKKYVYFIKTFVRPEIFTSTTALNSTLITYESLFSSIEDLCYLKFVDFLVSTYIHKFLNFLLLETLYKITDEKGEYPLNHFRFCVLMRGETLQD